MSNIITKEQLKRLSPQSKDEIITDVAKYLSLYMSKYELNSYLRVCHFISQAAHESAGFKTLREYASGSAYEGRKDLGNVKAGDGVRYKGRGIFQLTGRSNYRDMGKKLGIDLENNPELAETPEVSVLTALEYWKSRNLNGLADRDDVENITKRINGGLNGYEDRKKYLAKAKTIIPKDFKISTEKVEQPLPPTDPIIPPIVVAKKGDSSPYVGDLQQMLVNKGWALSCDGIFGPKTEQAVKEFQQKNNLKVTGQIDTDTLNKLMV